MECGRKGDDNSSNLLVRQYRIQVGLDEDIRVQRLEPSENLRGAVTNGVEGPQPREIANKVLAPVATADDGDVSISDL